MKGNLIFCGRNFVYNEEVGVSAISERFSDFFCDLVEIDSEHPEEIGFLYDTDFMECMPDKANDIISFAQSVLGKRERALFFQILARAQVVEKQYGEIEKMSLFSENEDCCNALAVLNSMVIKKEESTDNEADDTEKNSIHVKKNDKEVSGENSNSTKKDIEYDSKAPYMQFDKYNIVYGKESWIGFRRQILGNHPEGPAQFNKACEYCFPEIIFGENCNVDLEYSLSECPRQLVYHLACMNDKYSAFVEKFPVGHQLNELLAAFAGEYNFYKAGSKQGSQVGKKACQYKYKGKDINCEGHWKIQYSDKDHSKKVHVRIYFFHGTIPGESRRIFVGSMSKHA